MKFRRSISLILIVCFLFTQTGLAQVLSSNPPVPPFFKGGSGGIYSPILCYLSVNTANPHNYFNFLMDRGLPSPQVTSDASLRGAAGDEAILSNNYLTVEAKKLINYFFLGLTLKDESFWVNLQPNEPGRITSDELSISDMGKVLLEQDLQLKKDVANLLNPQNPVGKQFWTKLYTGLSATRETVSVLAKTDKFKETVSDPINLKKLKIETNNRVWIVPDKAVVMETEDGALVAEAKLKVLLESEYLQKTKEETVSVLAKTEKFKETVSGLSESLMKQIILPAITNEVNSSPRYAPLRQIYHSLILAQWFKRRVKGQGLRGKDGHNPYHLTLASNANPYAAYLNSGITKGLESIAPWSKDALFKQYLESYTKGEYKVKEKLAGLNRMYFSGGVMLGKEAFDSALEIRPFSFSSPIINNPEVNNEISKTVPIINIRRSNIAGETKLILPAPSATLIDKAFVEKILADKLGLTKPVEQLLSGEIYWSIEKKGGLLTEAEHAVMFDLLWEKNLGKYGVYLSAGLKNKIISHRDISSYLHILQSGIDNRVPIQEIQSLGLTPAEHDELWAAFRVHNPAVFNRTSDEINSKVVSIYKYIDAALSSKDSVKVLDLGCGAQAVGIQTFKGKYKEKIEAYGIDQKITVIANNVTLAEGRINKMPWQDNSFDLIYASNVVYYFKESELPDILKEVYRVLKPNGKFIFDDMPNTFELRKDMLKVIDPQANVNKDRIEARDPFMVITKSAPSAKAERISSSLANKSNKILAAVLTVGLLFNAKLAKADFQLTDSSGQKIEASAVEVFDREMENLKGIKSTPEISTLPSGYKLTPDYLKKVNHVLLQFDRRAALKINALEELLNLLPDDIKVSVVIVDEKSVSQVDSILSKIPFNKKQRVDVIKANPGNNYTLSPWSRDAFLSITSEQGEPIIITTRSPVLAFTSNNRSDYKVPEKFGEMGYGKVYQAPFDIEAGNVLVGSDNVIYVGDNMGENHQEIEKFFNAPVEFLPSWGRSHIDTYVTFVGKNKAYVGKIMDLEDARFEKSAFVDELKEGLKVTRKLTAEIKEKLEQTVEILKKRGYEVERLPWLPPLQGIGYITYNNAFFLDQKTVIVPVYGLPFDKIAVEQYEKDGYKVLTFNAKEVSKGLGAGRCIINPVGYRNIPGSSPLNQEIKAKNGKSASSAITVGSLKKAALAAALLASVAVSPLKTPDVNMPLLSPVATDIVSVDDINTKYDSISKITGIKIEDLWALEGAETDFLPDSVSKDGAVGPLQVMKKTVDDLNDYIIKLAAKMYKGEQLAARDEFNYKLIRRLAGKGLISWKKVKTDPQYNRRIASINLGIDLALFSRFKLVYFPKLRRWEFMPKSPAEPFNYDVITAVRLSHNAGRTQVWNALRIMGPQKFLRNLPYETRDYDERIRKRKKEFKKTSLERSSNNKAIKSVGSPLQGNGQSASSALNYQFNERLQPIIENWVNVYLDMSFNQQYIKREFDRIIEQLGNMFVYQLKIDKEHFFDENYLISACKKNNVKQILIVGATNIFPLKILKALLKDEVGLSVLDVDMGSSMKEFLEDYNINAIEKDILNAKAQDIGYFDLIYSSGVVSLVSDIFWPESADNKKIYTKERTPYVLYAENMASVMLSLLSNNPKAALILEGQYSDEKLAIRESEMAKYGTIINWGAVTNGESRNIAVLGKKDIIASSALNSNQQKIQSQIINKMLKEARAVINNPKVSGELKATAGEFEQIYLKLPELAVRIMDAYQAMMRVYGFDPGESKLYMVGGRVRGQPLKTDSDIDLVFTTAKPINKNPSENKLFTTGGLNIYNNINAICRQLGVKNKFDVTDYSGKIIKDAHLLLASRSASSAVENFMPLETALGQVKQYVEAGRGSGNPVFIIIDGAGTGNQRVGKTTLVDAIDYNKKIASYEYGGNFKNLGLENLKQNVLTIRGDALHKLFSAVRKGKIGLEDEKNFSLPYQVMVDIKDKVKEPGLYEEYLAAYAKELFSRMDKNGGKEDRIVVFEEAASHRYFQEAFREKALEKILVIKSYITVNSEGVRKMSVAPYFWDTDGTFQSATSAMEHKESSDVFVAALKEIKNQKIEGRSLFQADGIYYRIAKSIATTLGLSDTEVSSKNEKELLAEIFDDFNEDARAAHIKEYLVNFSESLRKLSGLVNNKASILNEIEKAGFDEKERGVVEKAIEYVEKICASSAVNKDKGGIDFSQIELTLKDEKYVSSLNPADLKILRAAKAFKEGWNSLSLLYAHEAMLMLEDKIALQTSITQNKVFFEVLKQLQSQNLLDPAGIQFYQGLK